MNYDTASAYRVHRAQGNSCTEHKDLQIAGLNYWMVFTKVKILSHLDTAHGFLFHTPASAPPFFLFLSSILPFKWSMMSLRNDPTSWGWNYC